MRYIYEVHAADAVSAISTSSQSKAKNFLDFPSFLVINCLKATETDDFFLLHDTIQFKTRPH
jgi:hypothetical protein